MTFLDNTALFTEIFSHEECKQLLLSMNGKPETKIHGSVQEYPVDLPVNLMNRLHSCVDTYIGHYNIKAKYLYDSSAVQATSIGIPEHYDIEVNFSDSEVVLQHFIVLTSLNGDDFEGGELIFPNTGRAIKFKTGTTFIFPYGVFYPHLVLPVLSDHSRFMLRSSYYFDRTWV